jgi:hypothetical protein
LGSIHLLLRRLKQFTLNKKYIYHQSLLTTKLKT